MTARSPSHHLSDGQLAVEFADSGPGLSEEALKKVFDPFFTTKKAGCGIGIGLSISYIIVERLGGRIEVRNGRQGGCVFRVNLPVAPPVKQENRNGRISHPGR